MKRFEKITIILLLLLTMKAFAGDLNPTSSPGPTMKTLDEVEPRIPIHKEDLPLVIKSSGSYYLAESIVYGGNGVGAGNAAISVESDSVTIDLCGFTLDGNQNNNSTAGIYSDKFRYITVKNGQVIGYKSHCIRLAGESSCSNCVENINSSASDNPIVLGDNSAVINCKVTFISNIAIKTGMNCIVDSCIVHFVYGSISTRGGIYVSDYSNVVGCSVERCPGVFGIKANSNCLIEKNTVANTVIGIMMNYGSTARNNHINNCATGITTNNGTNLYYRALIENNFIDSSFYGIEVGHMASVKNNCITDMSSKGIIVKGDHNSIEGNTIISTSSAKGIEITGNKNLYLYNRLSNTTNIDITGSGNVDGGENKMF